MNILKFSAVLNIISILFSLPSHAADPNYANWKVVRQGSLRESGQKFTSLKVRHIQNPENEKEEFIEVDYCESNGECKFAHRIAKDDFDAMRSKGSMGIGFYFAAFAAGLFTMGIGAAAMGAGEKLANGPYYRVSDLNYTLDQNTELHSGGKPMDDFKRELDTAVRRFKNKYVTDNETSSAPADNSAPPVSSAQ